MRYVLFKRRYQYMISAIGLELKYNGDLSATENLFVQLYGRTPRQDCSKELRGKLISILIRVNQTDNTELLLDFFRLSDEANWLHGHSLAELLMVDRTLTALRERTMSDILYCFGECETHGQITPLLSMEALDIPNNQDLDDFHKTLLQRIDCLLLERQELKIQLSQYEKTKDAVMASSTRDMERRRQKALSLSFADLKLTALTHSKIRQSGILTVDELTRVTVSELLKVHSIGRKTVEELQQKLAVHELSLHSDLPFIR